MKNNPAGTSAETDDPDLQQINFRVPRKVHRQAKRLAALNQVSLAELAKRLLIEEIVRSHQELQQATEEEIRQALAEQKTFESDMAGLKAELETEHQRTKSNAQRE